MEIVFPACAGLDVHKKSLTVCVLVPGPTGDPRRTVRTFSTMPADLLALADWLTQQAVTHVVMESTGEFWKPVYNILEPLFTVWIVNARHVKAVPGRKTDVKDAEWLADLLRHGLVRPSFIPPLPQRDLRDLTRQRAILGQERAAVINRLHKVLEWANLKLTSVVSDVTGVSARAILTALVAGEADPAVLADLAQGRLRQKRAALEQALQGHVRDHHRFLITQHLTHLDFLEEQIGVFDEQISHCLQATAVPVTPAGAARNQATSETPDQPCDNATALQLLDTLPGFGRRVAEVFLAEVGSDMSRFPSAAHLASGAKVAPGNNVSAGKRYSGQTGQGSRWLRSCLVQAAHAAVRKPESYLGAVYRRLVVRLGVKRAIIAVARRLLTTAYYMLLRGEPYQERGTGYHDERRQQQAVSRLRRRIEQLGYKVTLESPAASTA